MQTETVTKLPPAVAGGVQTQAMDRNDNPKSNPKRKRTPKGKANARTKPRPPRGMEMAAQAMDREDKPKALKRTKAPGEQKPKAKAAPPKGEGSLAEFVDGLLLAGEWEFDELFSRVKDEAERRGNTQFAKPGGLRAHIRFRAKSKQWKLVTMTDKKVHLKPQGETPPKS